MFPVEPHASFSSQVVVASFCSNAIVDGIVMSAGMFAKPLTEEFGVSASAVSLHKMI